MPVTITQSCSRVDQLRSNRAGAYMSDTAVATITTEQAWAPIILLMTWVAGSMDAISYLGPGHVFPANMTGNTVLLGIALGEGDLTKIILSLITMCGYIAGVALADLTIEYEMKASNRDRAIAGAVWFEGALLTGFAIAWHFASKPSAVYWLIILAGTAMGIQSAAMKRLKLPSIATTYITGTITSLTLNVVDWFQTARALRSKEQRDQRLGREVRVELQAGVFLTYIAGAMATGLLKIQWPSAVTAS